MADAALVSACKVLGLSRNEVVVVVLEFESSLLAWIKQWRAWCHPRGQNSLRSNGAGAAL